MSWINDDKLVLYRESISNIKKYIVLAIFAICILSFLHLLYYTFLKIDDTLFRYSGVLFSHIVTAFNLDYKDYTSYLITSGYLFAINIPLVVVHSAFVSLESWLIKKNENYLKDIAKKEIKKAKKDIQKEFDIIKKYSICLSFDYENEKITEKTKKELNRKLYTQIKQYLTDNIVNGKEKINLDINYNDVLIVTSKDFTKYDYVYAYILKILSYFKMNIKNKYKLDLVPSLTTDAHIIDFPLAKMEKRHKQLKALNFKNRATSTETFSRKYKYLKQNRYAGIPIGLYTYENSFEKEDSFDLNIIYKNLGYTLTKGI